MGKIVIQDCARCNLPPTLKCDTKEGSDNWNISHRCPDGLVSRGARGYYQDAVIQEWNRQQIAASYSN